MVCRQQILTRTFCTFSTWCLWILHPYMLDCSYIYQKKKKNVELQLFDKVDIKLMHMCIMCISSYKLVLVILHMSSSQVSIIAGKCQTTCKGSPPRSRKKTRNAVLRSAKDWQEGQTTFSWRHNCYCFVLKPRPNIQRHGARPSTFSS